MAKTKDETPAEPTYEDGARPGQPREVPETELTDHEIVQRRTPTVDGGPEWPADGRFRKVFHIAAARVSRPDIGEPTDNWHGPEYDSMHEANKVAVLQDALNHGLHPRGEAELDDATEPDGNGMADLTYSVECVPASTEPTEDTAALTYTPSQAIADQGGSTLVEADGGPPEAPDGAGKASDTPKGK